jgi:hypothetical protein
MWSRKGRRYQAARPTQFASGSIKPDALPGVDLRLAVQRKVIGVLGDQHLRDQRFGGKAALDDPRRCLGLHDRALARTAAIARTAGDEDTEGGWHHIEAFGYILADLVERAAAARAGPNAINFLDIDDLLDPFEMGWERTPVGLTWALSGVRLALAQACSASANAVSTSSRASSN